MHSLPSFHAAAALGITVVTLALFASARIRIELVCLGVVATLALGLYLFPLEVEGRFSGMEFAFGGFGHEALVAICGLMIIGRGLVVTGALDPAAHALARIWRASRTLGMVCSLLVCAGLSMFVNDTPVLVLALPILLSLAVRAGVPASKTLMPVNCAILIGGMGTTIGTSTNILVTSIATDLGMPRLGIFAFTDVALIAGAVALPYLWFVMPRLLPARTLEETEAPRQYEAVLHVNPAPGVQRTLGWIRAKLLTNGADQFPDPQYAICGIRAIERVALQLIHTSPLVHASLKGMALNTGHVPLSRMVRCFRSPANPRAATASAIEVLGSMAI